MSYKNKSFFLRYGFYIDVTFSTVRNYVKDKMKKSFINQLWRGQLIIFQSNSSSVFVPSLCLKAVSRYNFIVVNTKNGDIYLLGVLVNYRDLYLNKLFYL